MSSSYSYATSVPIRGPGTSSSAFNVEQAAAPAPLPTDGALQGCQVPLMSKKRLLVIGTIIVVAVIAIAVGVAVGGKSPTAKSDPTSTNVDYEARFTAIRTLLASHSDPTTFSSPSTPQSQALQWLVYQDKQTLSLNERRVIQRYAIMVLYYACSGVDWPALSTPFDKLTGTHECTFYGIECNDSEAVTKVDLHFQRLAGRLPEEIASLTDLVTLDLADNFLEGPIPSSIYTELTNLKHLRLQFNEFTSTIDPSIAHLKQLEELSLQNNYLSGILPISMRNMTSLKVLDIAYNDLTGEVFSLMSYWPQLEEFLIDRTFLSGHLKPEIGELTHLRTFSVMNTGMTGSLPSTFTKLTNLETIKLKGRTMNVSIPEDLGDLTNLESIFLIDTRHAGTIPTSIGKLSALKEMELSFLPNLHSTLPTEMGQLSRLKRLTLEGTALSGTIPTELATLKNLAYFYVSFNLFTGTVDAFCNIREFFYGCRLQCSCCIKDCTDCSKSDPNQVTPKCSAPTREVANEFNATNNDLTNNNHIP